MVRSIRQITYLKAVFLICILAPSFPEKTTAVINVNKNAGLRSFTSTGL